MRFIFLFLLTTALLSCKHDDNRQNCSGELVCTEIFVSIIIDVLDSEGEPLQLDAYTLTNLDTEETLNLPQLTLQPRYPIANDSMLDSLPPEGHRIEFVGIIDGVEVVRQTFLVGHDCCHVVLMEGPTTIQLSL